MAVLYFFSLIVKLIFLRVFWYITVYACLETDDFKRNVRNVLVYEFQAASIAAEIARHINNAVIKQVVRESMVQILFPKFRNVDSMTDNQPRCGWPREVERAAVSEAINDKSSLTTRMFRKLKSMHKWIISVANFAVIECTPTRLLSFLVVEGQKEPGRSSKKG